jgi:hypothetical protein
MDKIEDYINEYGGKHGWLLFAREKGIRVPEIYVWKIHESPDFHKLKRIFDISREGTGAIIIRTSVPDDFRGIIDQMPTHVLGIPESEVQLARWIKWIIEELEQDYEYVKEHAELEWTNYVLKDVTFSISPYLGNTTFMGTEHPNFDWILADTQVKSSEDNIHIPSEWWGIQWHKSLSMVKQVQESIRQLLGLPLDTSYQFEVWCEQHETTPELLQLREFARRNPLEVDKGVIPNLRYFLGNNWRRIIVPTVSFRYLNEVLNRTNPYAAHMIGSFWQLKKWELKNNAQGIITPKWGTCLSHILTQPVVDILKRRGFALLNILPNADGQRFDPGRISWKQIYVFHDPSRWIDWKQVQD